MKNLFRKLVNLIISVQKVIVIISFIIMATTLIADIIGREIFNHGIYGSVAFAVFFMVFATFSGMTIGTQRNAHIRPRLLDNIFPKTFEPVIGRLSSLTSALIVGYLAIAGYDFVLESIDFDDRSVELDWVVWPVQAVIPVGFASIALLHLSYFIYPDLQEKQSELKTLDKDENK